MRHRLCEVALTMFGYIGSLCNIKMNQCHSVARSLIFFIACCYINLAAAEVNSNTEDSLAGVLALASKDNVESLDLQDRGTIQSAVERLSEFGLWQFGPFQNPADYILPHLDKNAGNLTDFESFADLHLSSESDIMKPSGIFMEVSPDYMRLLDIRASLGHTEVIRPSIDFIQTEGWNWYIYLDLDNEFDTQVGNQFSRLHHKIARRLALLDSPETVIGLIRLIENNAEPWEAAKTLATLKDERAIEPLAQLLDHEDRSVRWSAAYVLATLNDPRAVTPLLELLNASHEQLEQEISNFTTGVQWIKQLVLSVLSEIPDRRILDTLFYLGSTEYYDPTENYAVGTITHSNSVKGVAFESARNIISQLDDAETIEKVVEYLAKLDLDSGSVFDPKFYNLENEFRNPSALPHLKRLMENADTEIRDVATVAYNNLSTIISDESTGSSDSLVARLKNSELGRQLISNQATKNTYSDNTDIQSEDLDTWDNCVSNDSKLRFPEAVAYIFSDPQVLSILKEQPLFVQKYIREVLKYRDNNAFWNTYRVDMENGYTQDEAYYALGLVDVSIGMLGHSDPLVRKFAIDFIGSFEPAYNPFSSFEFNQFLIDQAHEAVMDLLDDDDLQVRTAAERFLIGLKREEHKDFGEVEVTEFLEYEETDIYEQYPWQTPYMEYEFIVFDEFSSESDETISLLENERIDRLMRSKNSWSNRMLEIMLDMGFFLPKSLFGILPQSYVAPIDAMIEPTVISQSFHTGNNTGAAVDREIIPVYLKIGEKGLYKFLIGGDRILSQDWFIREYRDRSWYPVRSHNYNKPGPIPPTNELVAMLHGDNVKVCQRAARELARSKDQRALLPLIAMLNDDNNKVRASAARSLALLADKRAVNALSALLHDADPNVRRWAAFAIGRSGGEAAIQPLLDALSWKNEYAHFHDINPALHGMINWEMFRHDHVQNILLEKSAYDGDLAYTLLPAVTEVDTYHRGMLFCVEMIGLRAQYESKLQMLQAFWRWRGGENTKVATEQIAHEIEKLRVMVGDEKYLDAYVLLFASILAVNNDDFTQARIWAEEGLAVIEEWDILGKVALSIILTESLVGENRLSDALRVIGEAHSILGTRQMPYRERGPEDKFRLEFIPMAEVLMTKAFVLSNLKFKWHKDAIEASDNAAKVLYANVLWQWIDGDQYTQLRGARIAPIQGSSNLAEGNRHGKIAADHYKSNLPHGIQEDHGYSLVVQAAIEEALQSGGDYKSKKNAYQVTEQVVLDMIPESSNFQFADPDRNSKYKQLVSLQRDVAAAQAESSAFAGISSAHVPLNKRQELTKKQIELAKFVQKLKKEHPDIAAKWARAPTDLTQLQYLLDSNTGILQYLVLDRESYAFLIYRDGIEIQRLHSEDQGVGQQCIGMNPEEGSGCFNLKHKVDLYRSLLRGTLSDASSNSGELGELGTNFSKILLHPFKESIDRLEHLVLVPNGRLHRLPWPALPWDGGYLIEHKTLTILPASSLFGALLAPPAEVPAGLLALGNPIPDEPGWSDLQSAQAQVEFMDNHFPGLAKKDKEILTGDEASRDALIGQDLRAHVLHFATHAESGSPEHARMLLTGGDLTYDDILGLNISNAPLVVLAACETGLGKIYSGDHVYSLADAFLQAHARSVVYSLWLVDDASTGELMEAFYDNIDQGDGTATALALAQRAMIGRGYPPGHWAGFVISQWTGGE